MTHELERRTDLQTMEAVADRIVENTQSDPKFLKEVLVHLLDRWIPPECYLNDLLRDEVLNKALQKK